MFRIVHLLFLAILLSAMPACKGGETSSGEPRRVKNIQFAAPGGQALYLDLYLPAKSDKPAPLVMFIHGGAFKFGNRDEGGRFVDWFAPRGIALASISYRFSETAAFPAQLLDVKAALSFLRGNAGAWGLDPARVGVWGESAGGYLSAMLALAGGVGGKKSKGSATADFGPALMPVKAACVSYGITDITRLYDAAHPEPADSAEAAVLGAPRGTRLAALGDIAGLASPVTWAAKGSPPVFIVHGRADRRVQVAQGELLHQALQAAGASSTLLVLPGKDHGGPDFYGDGVKEKIIAWFAEKL